MSVLFSVGWLAVTVFIWLRGEQLHDPNFKVFAGVLLAVWIAEVIDEQVLRERRRRRRR